MTNKMKRLLTAVLVLMISISLFVIPAQAADYTPEVTIPVTVKLTGTLPQTPDTFRVILTRPQGSENPMPAGAEGDTAVLSFAPTAGEDGTAVETKSFALEFNKLGIYTYTIHQASIGDDDCYQSTKSYNVTVYVTNNSSYDGFETSVAIYERDANGESLKEQGKVPVNFENRYANPVKVPLTAIKTMDRKTPKDKAFTFKLVDENKQLVERVENIGQDVVFTPLVFDKSGTYTYTMYEVMGLSLKISYDRSQYTVTIVVDKDENGDYKAEVTYLKGDKEYEGTPKFQNFTKTDTPTTGDMFRMGLWVGLMGGSLAALIVLIVVGVKKFKKKPEDQKE